MRILNRTATIKLLSITLLGLSWLHGQTDTAGSDSIIHSSGSQAHRRTIKQCWDLLVKTHFPMPDQKGRFTIESDSVRGAIVMHGSKLTIREGKVDDNQIRFAAGSSGDFALFEGELNNSVWSGSMTNGHRRLRWTAGRCRDR